MFKHAGALLLAVSTSMRPAVQTPSATPPRYATQHDGAVIRLVDAGSQTHVSILPSAGNLAVDMKVKGHDVLRVGKDGSSGIPFLAPWADRLDEQAFYANGRRFAFDMNLGNVRGAFPIHGFLSSANAWQVLEAKADADSAWVTSRLDFFRHPDWLRQFPFAHTIEMTHRLRNGSLEVATQINNLSAEPMPVAIGFHPYFQLTDSPRDEWTISVAANTYWPMGEHIMPVGTTAPIETFFPHPQAVTLKGLHVDNVFSDLVRDGNGRAVMSMQGKSQRLEVALGPNFRAVVVYAPKPDPSATGGAAARNFVCLEPLAGIINALNLAHKGIYRELQTIPPDGVWRESFWIRPRGF
jgi:aldose 1-epimerase